MSASPVMMALAAFIAAVIPEGHWLQTVWRGDIIRVIGRQPRQTTDIVLHARRIGRPCDDAIHIFRLHFRVAFEQRLVDAGHQLIRTNIAKPPLFIVRPAVRGPYAVNDYTLFHLISPVFYKVKSIYSPVFLDLVASSSARSTLRNILPTADLGSSFRNSTILGAL